MYIFLYTLFCILTSILLLDSNRETISLCPFNDALANEVQPPYIIYTQTPLYLYIIKYIFVLCYMLLIGYNII